MSLADTVLYERFVDARRQAVALTDQYHQIPSNDPRRQEVWDRVVRQTETARVLLESWLGSGRDEPLTSLSPPERPLVQLR